MLWAVFSLSGGLGEEVSLSIMRPCTSPLVGGATVFSLVIISSSAVACAMSSEGVPVLSTPLHGSIGETGVVGGANISFEFFICSIEVQSLIGERFFGDVGVVSEESSFPLLDICEYTRSPGYCVKGGESSKL